MNNAIERLLSRRVADVMNYDVVTISANASMAEAAKKLTQHEISGAPVVDEQGHCVGMLTHADFAHRDSERDARGNLPPHDAEFSVVRDGPDEPFHVEHCPPDTVRHFMSEGVQTIQADALISEAARSMCHGHLHRLVVLDESAHPVGIVSSLDLVAAMMGAIEQ